MKIFKKRVGSIMQGQVFLKRVVVAEGADTFNLDLFNFFKWYHSLLHLEINLLFAKLCYTFEEKKFFQPP